MSKKADCPAWLATFADLMSLLMAIFVLLFAMSTLDANKYEAIVKSLSMTLGHGSDLTQTQVEYFKQVKEEQKQDAELDGETVIEQLKPLYESLIDTYSNQNYDNEIEVTMDPERKQIKVTFPESISFAPGRADLKKSAIYQLRKLKVHITDEILVKAVGHTDKRPVTGGHYSSNWDLSSARAAAVVEQMLKDKVIQPRQVEVIGVASSQPISEADTEEAFAKNRRVEILLIPEMKKVDADLLVD